MAAMAYRRLTEEERCALEKGGCSAEDWSGVKVCEGFLPERVKGVSFAGVVKLGIFSGEVTLRGGFTVKCGIYGAHLRNCEIGNDCYIENVGFISDYRISEGCVIRNVDRLYIEGETAFGNGTEVSVLDEMGGRKIPIYNKLSSTLAYMAVLYRHSEDFVRAVQHLVADYSASITSKQGFIGASATVENCSTIVNVRIGESAVVRDVARLENGSLNSTPESPVVVSNGVTAKDFILSSGVSVTDGAYIERCFVGEASHISCGFTAHDSLIFANCEFEKGEACSLFAGPHSVSHHKSTLLIGAMVSFFNAGSGSNQSNHLYKLGPMHYGLTGRGVKFASGSYLQWPAKIGAFTTVVGHHSGNPDTTDFPFSYLVESGGESLLVPGVALGSIGLLRDVTKWPKRDGRMSLEPTDAISYEWLSPYTVAAMFKGRNRLEEILSECPTGALKEKGKIAEEKRASKEEKNIANEQVGKRGESKGCVNNDKDVRCGEEFCECGGLRMKVSAVERAVHYYTLAIRIFLGEWLKEADGSNNTTAQSQKPNQQHSVAGHASPATAESHVVASNAKQATAESHTALATIANPAEQAPLERWVDAGGLLAPKGEIDHLMQMICYESDLNITKVQRQITALHAGYDEWCEEWCAEAVKLEYGPDYTTEEVIAEGRRAKLELYRIVLADAGREFSDESALCFGADGSEEDCKRDLEAVRGVVAENPVVCAILEEIIELEKGI